jgi:hypothetical protein
MVACPATCVTMVVIDTPNAGPCRFVIPEVAPDA